MRPQVIAAMVIASACAARAQVHNEVPPAPTAAASSTAIASALKIKSCPTPEYPSTSWLAGEEGIAHVRIQVNEAGIVTETAVKKSSGYPRLDAAARKAATQCRFLPPRNAAGEPIRSMAILPFDWRLDAAPDPWQAVRSGSITSFWQVSEDLAAIAAAAALTTPAQTTLEQRTTILRRIQEVAIKHANCGQIDNLTIAPVAADRKFPPLTDPKTGREMRIVRELWRANQCGIPMTYALVMRFPEGEVATFNMVPSPATTQNATPLPK